MKFLFSVLFVIVLFAGCGNDEEAFVPPVKHLPLSSTVNEVYETFLTDIAKSDVNQTELIKSLSDTLEAGALSDDSPDLTTALAFMKVFHLLDDPLISNIIKIDISQYDNLVPSLLSSFEQLDFNSILQGDFSTDFPAFAHKVAVSFKELSDALEGSFPDKYYVFRYWTGDGLVYNDALTLRSALLGAASFLELMSTYSYGVPADYTNALADPASVLNTGNVFVYNINESNNSNVLKKARDYFTEMFVLAQDIDVEALPQTDGIDYALYKSFVKPALENLQSSNPTTDLANIDLGGLKKFDVNFVAMFSESTIIDINDFRKVSESPVNFAYNCGASEYNKTKSLVVNFPTCDNDTNATIQFIQPPSDTLSNLGDLIDIPLYSEQGMINLLAGFLEE